MANLKALKALCTKHNLILLEDACQALGGTYEGKALGSHGDLGCFSFDFVKTITCGEGGAIITNNEAFAINADQYQDHGHDHIGKDRGAETHPYLGYNFRISELHAAVGKAQLTKLDTILATQKHNYTILREALSEIEGVTFRRVPESGEENYSFLNFFLPTQELAEKTHKVFASEGIDGCFYWFKNNWHYINGWEHLRKLKSLGKLPMDIRQRIQDFNTIDFAQSDHWMGRNLSCLVKLGWSEDEVLQRANTMKRCLKEIISKVNTQ